MSKKRKIKHPLEKPDEKAEVKVPSLVDNLPLTPRERRDLRRQTALDEAEKATRLRQKPKAKAKVKSNGKV